MSTSIVWNTGSGDWFGAANWDEANPAPPPPTLHHVPINSNDASLPDNSNVGTPFTVSYNGTSTVNTLTAAGNATLNISGGALTTLNGGTGFGTLNVLSGATFSVTAGTFTANSSSWTGTVGGSGTFRAINGTFNVNAGASVTINTWLLTYQVGSATVSTTNINTDLTFANTFQLQQVLGNYPILNLNSHTLTLSGTSTTLEGVINGAGALKITGSGTMAGGVVDGGATLQVAGTLSQTGSYGLDGTLQIDASGTYTVSNASNISDVGAAVVLNNGTLTVTGAAQSVFDADLTNNGVLSVSAGAQLALNVGTQALNGTISGAGQINFGFAHNATLNPTAISVGAISVNGGNGGGTLSLGKSFTYAGNFTFANAFGTLDIAGFTLTLSGTSVFSAGNVDGAGTVRITGSSTVGSIGIGTRATNVAAAEALTFQNSGSVSQNGGISVNGTILNDAAHTWTLGSFDISPTGAGGVFTNNGTLVSNAAAGTGTISIGFTNGATGAISIANNAVLRLAGTSTLGGAIGGQGGLTLSGTAGVNTAITTASLAFNGTTTLGVDLAYANVFSIGVFSTTNLGGHTLTLGGTSTLTSGFNKIDGTGTLKITGTSTVGGVTFGDTGAVTVQNAGTVTQTDGISLKGTLLNDAGRTYTLMGTGISNNGATVTNNGTLSAVVSTVPPVTANEINAAFTNAGTLTVGVGATLKLSGTNTLGGTISGAGGLILSGASTVNTAITTASLAFNGTTTLGVDLAYANVFSIGAFSTTNLGGHTLTLSGTSTLTSGFNKIDGTGTLKITGTSTVGGVTFGDTGAVTVQNAGTVTQTDGISLKGTLINDAGRTYTLMGTGISNNGATVTNNGTLSAVVSTVPPVTANEINAAFTNAGTLTVGAGATLKLSGMNTLGGTISGAGGLILSGASTVNTAITTASLAFNGTTTLGVNLSYGGVFSIGAFSTTNLGGHTLTLGGASSLVNGFNTINGGALRITGTATVGGVGLGANAAITVQNSGAVNQIDGVSINGGITNDAGRVWTLGAGNITGSGATFANSGTFLKTGSSSSFSVEPIFTNNGLLNVFQGTLVVQNLTNIGVIAGVITQNGAQFTIVADATNATTLTGGSGNSRLDGGVGADFMSGGGGNDTYIVDNAGDVIVEGAGQGTLDIVAASVSYVLGAGVQVEQLQTTDSSGLGAINLTGNEFVQTISGNDGVNRLDGKGGADTMIGRGGNDVYIVDNAGDVIVEGTGGGTADLVASFVSYVLGSAAQVEILQTTDAAGTAAINLTGNDFVQTITGNDGINRLDGKGGADTMIGRGGNDTYIVDNAGDMIVEGAGQGTLDLVATSVNYALRAGVQVEQLQTLDGSGLTAINLTGNAFVQTLIGNGGVNRLDGGGGGDTMRGLGGNDTYIVDNAGDVVVEGAGQGTLDLVATSVSYVLGAGVQVEQLQTLDSSGLGALNLTGNEFVQTLIGNNGVNRLDGKAGADTMRGLGGNDTYIVDNTGDVIVEGAGQGILDLVAASVGYALAAGVQVEQLQTVDGSGTTAMNLYGNEFAQTIIGNNGANQIAGGLGLDTLTGRGGADLFLFNTALSAGNIDRITDFSVVDDTIRLDHTIFTGLGTNVVLDNEAYYMGAAATETDDRIIYDNVSGALYFDADGSNAGAQVQFATLSPGLTTLSNTDFFVV